MNIAISFLAMVIGGYITGIIVKNNLFLGIFLLLIGIGILAWSYYKKYGHFKEGDKPLKFILLSLIGLIAFNLAIFNIPKLESHYIFPLFLFALFIYAISVTINDIIKSGMFKKKKK